MPLSFNGTTINNVIYNGKEVTKVVYNNTTVWEASPFVFTRLDNGTYSVSVRDKSIAGAITIPSTYGSASVTEIDTSAFANCTLLTSVTIPDSIISIGGSAFRNCSSLESVIVGDSVSSIGAYAFAACTSLISVTMGSSVKSILAQAFANCTSLTYITIPDSVTTVGNSVFVGCSNLTIYGEATSQPSGWGANWNPNNCPVYWIGNLTFTLLNGGWQVAAKNTSISGDVDIPDIYYGWWVQSIATEGFAQCTSLTGITIPASVDFIPTKCFYNCSALTRASLLSIKMETIGESAFEGCSSLASITIPNSVAYIYDYAFSGCSALTSVNIPDNVRNMGEYAFQNCTALENISLSNQLGQILSYTFNGCTSLTSVTIPANITEVRGGAFKDCTSLTNLVILGNDTTSIITNDEGYVYLADPFINCTSLINVTIPASANVKIPWSQLQTLVITDGDGSMTSVPAEHFSGWSNLRNITLPSTIESIGEKAFYNCTSLAGITIPIDVETLGESAFEGCTSLKTLKFDGNNLNNIPDKCFYNCSSLTSFVFPEDITRLGNSAFYGCSSLAVVGIPNVTSIGYNAFAGCTSLSAAMLSSQYWVCIDDPSDPSSFLYVNATSYSTPGLVNASILTGRADYELHTCQPPKLDYSVADSATSAQVRIENPNDFDMYVSGKVTFSTSNSSGFSTITSTLVPANNHVYKTVNTGISGFTQAVIEIEPFGVTKTISGYEESSTTVQ